VFAEGEGERGDTVSWNSGYREKFSEMAKEGPAS